jgi:hypothetical protein
MGVLNIKEAKRRKICRYCQEPNTPATRPDGTVNAFVFNFGEEYAHEDCIKWYNSGEPGRIPKPPINEAVLKSITEEYSKQSNPCKEVALRFNSGKPKCSYILHYPRVIELLSRILEVGEAKYGRLNWKKGGNTDESYLDPAMRHQLKFVNGEPFDQELGTHHIGHAIWNLMTMFELNGHEVMDTDKFNEALERLKNGRPADS